MILALRNLPAEKVGKALTTLARSWDGQDRWYLEALGLALDSRDSAFIQSLFDGSLYGDLNLDDAGQASKLALPPYFPADRNEAYIAVGTKDQPASPLSKTLGLMWRVHKFEMLPLFGRVLPKLASPELQQAADDILAQMREPATAFVLVDLANVVRDPDRCSASRSLYLEPPSDGQARRRPRRHDASRLATIPRSPRLSTGPLKTPRRGSRPSRWSPRSGARGTVRHPAERFADRGRQGTLPGEVRVAAVRKHWGALSPGRGARELARPQLDPERRGKASSSDVVAEAAVRTIPPFGDQAPRRLMAELVAVEGLSAGHPPRGGCGRSAESATAGATSPPDRPGRAAASSPAESEDREATTVVHSHPDRRVRQERTRVLPPLALAGRPPFTAGLKNQSIAPRTPRAGPRLARSSSAPLLPSAEPGGWSTSCGGCHRVQGPRPVGRPRPLDDRHQVRSR